MLSPTWSTPSQKVKTFSKAIEKQFWLCFDILTQKRAFNCYYWSKVVLLKMKEILIISPGSHIGPLKKCCQFRNKI